MGRKRHQTPLKAAKTVGVDKFMLLPAKAIPGAFTRLIDVTRVDGERKSIANGTGVGGSQG